MRRRAARERGFCRPAPGPDDFAAVIAVASGFAMVFTGAVGNLRWEMQTAGVLAAPGAKDVTGERRLYALVDDGLGYATEIATGGLDFAPHLSARLDRVPAG